MAASHQTRPVTVSNPRGVAAPLGRYSHVAHVPAGCRMLVLAGQVGMRPDGSVADGLAAQFEGALENVVTILRSQDAGPEHIIKLNTWIVDGSVIDYEQITAARLRLLGDARPPSTLAYVSRLFAPEFLLELEAWAAIPS